MTRESEIAELADEVHRLHGCGESVKARLREARKRWEADVRETCQVKVARLQAATRRAEVDRDAALTQLADARAQLADVQVHHWTTTAPWPADPSVQARVCGRCRYKDGTPFAWPCPTVAAVLGEQPGNWASPTPAVSITDIADPQADKQATI